NHEKLLSSRQRSLNEHVNRIRQYESEKNVKNERLRFLQDKISNLSEQIEQDEKNAESLKIDLQKLENEQMLTAEDFGKLSENTLNLQADYEKQRQTVQNSQQEINQENQQLRNLQNAFFELRRQVESKQTQLETLQQEQYRNEKNNIQNDDIEGFDEEMYEIREQVSQADLHVKNHQQELTEIKEKSANTELEIEKLRHEIAHLNRRIDACQNEYNLTQSLVENLEGFPEAIKFLKQQVREMKNMPLLSDILTCPDRYRVAIENFLEPFMNFFVAETQNQAFQAVNLLADASKGKANFFVLESLTDQDSFPLEEGRGGASGLAAFSVVEFDKKYENLIHFLLGGVYLVTNEEALAGNGYKTYLAETGKFIKKPHSISGGSVGLFEGKRIGRAKNLENLAKEIKSHSADLQILTQKLATYQHEKVQFQHHLQEAEKNLSQARQHLQNLNQELISVRTKQEQLRTLLSVQALRKDEMQVKMADLQIEIEELRPEADEKKYELSLCEQKITFLNQELSQQNENLNLKSAEFNQQNILFYQQKNRAESLAQEIRFKNQNLESSLQRLQKNEVEKNSTQADLRKLLDSNDIQEDELLEMYKEKETISEAVTEAERVYYACRGAIDSLEKEIRETQRQREMADALLNEMHGKRNEARLQLTAIRERLSVEFEVNLSEVNETGIKDADTEKLSEDEIRGKVQTVKNNLEKVGP
ncbi:MAG: chromosome segregation protein SMC, partial [Verrucomicrobia bacterium]|nr:chromosome segregation protein SMC [Cytophagales bacterium]